MKGARLVTLVVLVLWVLLGPVGMALSGCMMMDGCDALCSVPSFAPIVTGIPFVQTSSILVPSDAATSPQNVWSVPDSPPKLASALL
jgi:hypothetical protein